MVIGLSAVFLLVLGFFFGTFIKIAKFFNNELTAIAILLFTVLFNIMPPVTIKNVTFYIGSGILFLGLMTLIFALNKKRKLFLNLLSIVTVSVILTLVKILLIDKNNINIYLSVITLSVIGGIVGFIFSIDPLSCFSSVYIAYYIADIVSDIIKNMPIGGAVSFNAGIFGGIIAVILYMFFGKILYKNGRDNFAFSYKAEASKEIK